MMKTIEIRKSVGGRMTGVGRQLLRELRARGYVQGKNLARAVEAGGISYPTFLGYLGGRGIRGASSKFSRFLRALRIPQTRFRRFLGPAKEPSTRLGRLLWRELRAHDLSILAAAKRADLSMAVWSWIWRGSRPRPKDLARFIQRNELTPESFREFLSAPPPQPPPRRTTPFTAYLDGAQQRLQMATPEFTRYCARGGFPARQVWRWRREGHIPRVETAIRLLDYLGASERLRAELLQVADRRMAETARKRDDRAGHPRARCRICGRARSMAAAKWRWNRTSRHREPNPTYQVATNTFEHRLCQAWVKRIPQIRGLTREACQRFATMMKVPVTCPACGRVRESRVGRLMPFLTIKGERRRVARITYRDGKLLQSCIGCQLGPAKAGRTPQRRLATYQSDAGQERLAVEKGGRWVAGQLARARAGDREALRELDQAWGRVLVAARKRKGITSPGQRGPRPTGSIGLILWRLHKKPFRRCNWCGLLIGGNRKLHRVCFLGLVRSERYRDRQRGRHEKLSGLRKHDVKTGRWQWKNGARPDLHGFVQDLFDRRYWAEAGPGLHPETAQKGCAWFIRHRAFGESHADVARREGTSRQIVAQKIEVFLRYAPGTWRDLLQISDRAAAALEARCPLVRPADDHARRLRAQDLAKRNMLPEDIARLTGLPMVNRPGFPGGSIP
jgi:hypothetical protein